MKIYTPPPKKKRKKEKKVSQYQFLLRYEETTRKTHWVARPVTEHLVSQRSANFWRVLL
jgi:isocitrate dehydrogenase kinase/phosphatase